MNTVRQRYGLSSVAGSLVLLSFAIIVSSGIIVSAGCGNGGSGSEAVAAQEASTALDVELSQLFVTVANRADRALLDVRVTIVPVGPVTFSASVPRLEPAQKHSFPMGNFRGRDGTPLNLRMVRPRSVRVHAADATGRTHELELPWRVR
jgi:hypothetical protein